MDDVCLSCQACHLEILFFSSTFVQPKLKECSSHRKWLESTFRVPLCRSHVLFSRNLNTETMKAWYTDILQEEKKKVLLLGVRVITLQLFMIFTRTINSEEVINLFHKTSGSASCTKYKLLAIWYSDIISMCLACLDLSTKLNVKIMFL